MSLFDRQGPAIPDPIDSSEDQPQPSTDSVTSSDVLMGTDTASTPRLAFPPDLDPHCDARAIVRLIQCPQCSLPLRQPLTLSCGNSLCRQCLPTLHKRENITYPMTPGRQEGFQCPFADCGQEHSLGDCSQDVTLAKVLDRVSTEVALYRPITSDTPMLLDERLHWRNVVDSSDLKDVSHSRVLSGGRLVATYTMAELGELRYDSELSYQTLSRTGDNYQHLDLAMLERLRELTRSELDCHVCYALMLDPLTTPCGHTYCRKCVARVLDHSSSCPICRRPLTLTPASIATEYSNKRLSNLLLAFCQDKLAIRVAAVEAEEALLAQSEQIPLFICTLGYPRIPTFLHIFEPRYRLMIRRAMEADRKFGMMLYNSRGETQGDLGVTQFLRYGTLLEIINMELLPDGRSLIETVGVSRFCVREHGMRDGYVVGRIDRVDDIPIAEEEALEAAEVSAAAAAAAVSASATSPSASSSSSSSQPPLNSLATSQLLQIGTSFIQRMRLSSAPWLSDSVIQAYGRMPEDAALFPFWFASVLPIDEGEKYRLLPTRSVRARLMICAEWVRRVERMRWFSGGSCIVL